MTTHHVAKPTRPRKSRTVAVALALLLALLAGGLTGANPADARLRQAGQPVIYCEAKAYRLKNRVHSGVIEGGGGVHCDSEIQMSAQVSIRYQQNGHRWPALTSKSFDAWDNSRIVRPAKRGVTGTSSYKGTTSAVMSREGYRAVPDPYLNKETGVRKIKTKR